MQVGEENHMEQAPQPQVQEFSDEKQPLIPDHKPEIPNDQKQDQHQQIHDGKPPQKQDEQQEQQIHDDQQSSIENNQILEIPKDQLSRIREQQQQALAEQLPQRQQRHQAHEEQQPLVENGQRPDLLIGQQLIINEQIQDAQQQQIPQVLERPQRQDEHEQEQHQMPEVQRPLNLNEQRLRQPNEQQGIGDEQISDEQQQQQQMPRRQRQIEQEPPIPDEVRQMPDAQQQEMLREIFNMVQLQRQELQQLQRQELHQFQRQPKNNYATLISIIVSIAAAVVIALLLRPQMDYVPRHEFESYKTDNQNGLVAVRENSRKSISEHEAKIVKFGKHWEEYLKNIMKPNTTVPELPDYSIENLLEADRKIQAEAFKLRTEVSNLQIEVSSLQNVNTQLKKSLDSVKARLQKVESMNEEGWFDYFKSVIKWVVLVVLSVLVLAYFTK